MRLAKSFNRLKNRRYYLHRKKLYETRLEDLFAENGSDSNSGLKIEDGWALDNSHTLPHLDQLIQDAQQIIAERGGVDRGGGERAFFQQILTDEHIRRFPSILNFATSNAVLRPVIDYLKFLPTLSVSNPVGVRLNESDQKFASRDKNGYSASQLFHCDYHDAPMVYVIVALRDITSESGPFSILPASVSQRARAALRYGRHGSPYRITDEKMYGVVDRSELFEFICQTGSVLFVDNSACFHYGSRDAAVPRYLMMYAYVSVCRTDFTDLLRKESPEPALDDRARTCRAKYPVRDGDSLLRRLVLDRETLADE